MTNFDREVAERMIARSQQLIPMMSAALNEGGRLRVEYEIASKDDKHTGMIGVDYLNWCIEHAAEYAQMVMFLLDERDLLVELKQEPIEGADDGTDRTDAARKEEIKALPRIGESFTRRWSEKSVMDFLYGEDEDLGEEKSLFVSVAGVSSLGRKMTSRAMAEFKIGMDRRSFVNAEPITLKVEESGVMTGLWVYHPVLGGHIMSMPRAVACKAGSTFSVETGRSKAVAI